MRNVLLNGVWALANGQTRNNESRIKDELYKVSKLGERERERSVEGENNTILLVWVHVYHHCIVSWASKFWLKGLEVKSLEL